MTKYQLLSMIIYRPWAINLDHALGMGNFVSLLLNPNVDFQPSPEPDKNKPYAVSFVQDSLKYPEGYSKAPKGSVAVIPIMGELMKYDEFCGPAGMQTIGQRIQEADQHANISSIMLLMDTPGGSVDGIQTLGEIIKNTEKPITAFIDGSCFSAGMWLASNADKIIASASHDEVGSIGVMSSFADMQPIWERMGVKFHEIYSNLSGDKNKLSREVAAGDYENYKKEKLDPLAQEFRNIMKANRPGVREYQLTGKTYFAKDVIGSLVDEIATFEQAILSTSALCDTKNKNQNKKKMKKKKLLKILAIDSIEEQDGGIFLTSEMVADLEAKIVVLENEANTAKAMAEKSNKDLIASTSKIEDLALEIQKLQENLENMKNLPSVEEKNMIKNGNNVEGSVCATDMGADLAENIDRVMKAYPHLFKK
jgi:protease-4